FQQFPEDESRPHWLLRLGSVNWSGPKQKFLPATDGRLNEARHYVGIVGEQLLAPAGALRLMPRVATRGPEDADLASVEGRLRVDGRIVAKKDVFLHGGKLSLQSVSGTDEAVPLWLQRRSGPPTDLQIHLGDVAAATTRLAIGPGPADGTNQTVVLAVKGDNTVDVN